MTGRSIFFGRVCSLRLFPLFLFSIGVAAPEQWLHVLSRRPRRENIPLGRKKSQPARINSARWRAGGARLWKAALREKLPPVNLFGLCFVTHDAVVTPDI